MTGFMNEDSVSLDTRKDVGIGNRINLALLKESALLGLGVSIYWNSILFKISNATFHVFCECVANLVTVSYMVLFVWLACDE